METENTDLLRFLQTEEENAKDTSLDAQRATALELYQGLPFGNEVEGRSSLVTRDVSETVDSDVAALLRIIFSGDQVVQFEAKNQADKQAADDATELMHYQFMRSQEGYVITHDWIKAGELEKNGVIKTWVEHRSENVEVETPAELLSQDEQGGLLLDGEAVQGADEVSPGIFRVTISRPLPAVFKDAVVPNEEFEASSDARDLDSAVYIKHETEKSLSDLRRMGFDVEDDLRDEGNDSRVISDARDADRSRRDDYAPRQGAMRKIHLKEEYVLFDMNGDGIAERLCVHRVGRTILSVVEVDDHPFEEWCPYPMTARRVGQSLADKTADIQFANSTLLRQAFDSLYLSTNPRTLLHEDAISENTVDDLLTVRSGGLIRFKGAIPPTPWGTLPVHEHAFQGIEALTSMRESRTGITRMNQGLDADLFNRTSATGTLALQSAGALQQEYRARNFVQSGFARLFMKKYRLMRQHASPTQIMVDGQPRMIDPSTWPEEIDIRIRVGLGTGNKDRRIQFLSTLLETQVEGIQNGSPLVTWKNVYNTSRQLIADMSIGNPSDYVTDPPEQEPQQQGDKPDPNVIKAQTEQMEAQGRAQKDAFEAQAKAQADAETRAAKIRIQEADAEHERQLKYARADTEAELARSRQAFEQGLALERFQFDKELAEKRAGLRASTEQDNIPAYRPGGDLDA